MRFAAIIVSLALAVPSGAAVIRGSVTEALTGSPLARTLIQIEPIPGTPGAAQSVRAGERGQFEFGALAAGGWVLKATRPGFLPIENGQRRWNSAGFPLIVAADDAPFVSLRMQRFGAVLGTVRDENEIGIADFDVTAWRTTQPPRLVARGKTDDRGIYRISGLEPGTYVIRSAAHTEDELQFIPTFAPATLQLETAQQPGQLIVDNESTSPVQNEMLPFQWQSTFWADKTGWLSIHHTGGPAAWLYFYNPADWATIKAVRTIAATKKYALDTKTSDVTKQIQHKVKILMPKVYFYMLLLLCCTFLWVEGKLPSGILT